MKRNKSLRIASILLISTLLSMCLLGGTFAKYTTATSGSDNVTVAKWSIRANLQEIAVSPQMTYEFGLFDTINDADGSEDEDVINDKIAPGTNGQFEMTVQNYSEVSAQYSIALEETNTSGVPIQYSLDGNNWSDSLSDIAATNLSNIPLDPMSKVSKHTLYWRWAFDNTTANAPASQSDASDSQLGHPGLNPIANVTVTATITASQVD